jgi:hypothetical protein
MSIDLLDVLILLIPGLLVYINIRRIKLSFNTGVSDYFIFIIGLLIGVPIIYIFCFLSNWWYGIQLKSITEILNKLKNSDLIIFYCLVALILGLLSKIIVNKCLENWFPKIQDKIIKGPYNSIDSNVWKIISRQYFSNKKILLVARLTQNNQYLVCGEVKSLSEYVYPNNKEIELQHENIIQQHLKLYDEFISCDEEIDPVQYKTLNEKCKLKYISTYFDFNSQIKIELFEGKYRT